MNDFDARDVHGMLDQDDGGRIQKDFFKRGASCRKDFLVANPGFHGLYMCRYCGRILKQRKMQVDHLVPVKKARYSPLARRIVRKYPKGVNDERNLVPACERCNKRKGRKMGLWLLLGYTGRWLQPVLL